MSDDAADHGAEQDPQPRPRPPRIEPAPPGTKMWCPDCDGRGGRLVERHAQFGGVPAFATQVQMCKTCGGSGRLKGMQPPV